MPHRFLTPASRYPPDPRAVFILSLCVVAGIPLVLGVSKPQSIEELMPAWVVVVWGFNLVAGSVATLIGMSLRTATGILMEQVGSVWVGAATLFYGTAIILVGGWAAGAAAAIVFGWGLSCFFRWAQLQALINTAVQEAADNDR